MRNLLTIFQAFTEWPDERMRQHFSGMRYGDLKKQVAEAVVAALEPVQQRYRQITSEAGYIASVLDDGARRVSPHRQRHGEHGQEGDGVCSRPYKPNGSSRTCLTNRLAGHRPAPLLLTFC